MTAGGQERALHAHIDEPANGTIVARGLLRVSGWAVDERGPVTEALLVAGAAPPVRVRLGLRRPDVEDHLPGIAHAGTAGFSATADLRATSASQVRVALLVRCGDEPWREAIAAELQVAEPERRRDGARPRAAFTIVKDEPMMLPLWLRHYGRTFGAEDLYVLDHDSTDGSTAALAGRAQVVPVHREAAFDHHWLRTTVESFQAFLLRSYDTVLFAEVDEFVLPDPLVYPDLGTYLDAMEGPAVRCTGFNVVHDPDEEPALRLDADSLLSQRRYWHASPEYSKRLVSRIPLHWSEGFHQEYAAPDDPPDPALLLIHLHRVDYQRCLDRHRRSAGQDWNAEDVRRRDGFQNRITAPDAFDEWFRRGPDLGTPRELIPEPVRAAL